MINGDTRRLRRLGHEDDSWSGEEVSVRDEERLG